MPYDPSIPAANDLRSDSQGDILSNFQTLDTIFGANHIAFSTGGATAGYHTQLNFPDNPGSSPNLAAPASSVFPQLLNGLAQLFFQNASAGSISELTGLPNPITRDMAQGYGIPTPWGITINYGSLTGLPTTQTFSWAIPFTTTVYGALLTPAPPRGIGSGSPNFWYSNVNTTTFQVTAISNVSLPSVALYFIAFGV